ncbi:DUF898 family protein [Candidatus Poribacteria bacterium]|jgi:uncharacterized membrane protein YjgN (DUF898 family)|nr:DUF898 family protein [Candidatus Poribacteria bacterium]MBT5534057.1 DUF898 family protein [Candidatus Poribacteria bacterium]MBT5710236.1 DUF898 family protein [Candidatus Poribacteria bacterium]MBT7096663.1 DUF898 family protein [Candidatus Poribacteria bacterium]MBT7807630.1 DUF898 family protein [Candidatus Poribacteria bacterium]
MHDATYTDDTPTHSLKFHGDGDTLFWLYLKTNLLTLLTLGVYASWGTVALRNYFLSNTTFAGHRLVYAGTGRELFVGSLKLLGIYIVLAVITAVLRATLGPIGMLVARVLLYVVLFALTPFALYSARRYRLSRTSLAGTRFSFRGSLGECYRVFMPGALVTGMTLGLYYPVWHTRMRAYWLRNTYYGSEPFAYDGEGVDLFGPFFISWLLLIPTLGLSRIRYKAAEMRHDAASASFAGHRFKSTVTGWEMFVIALRMLLFSLITLGLAYPWLLVRAVKYYTSRLALIGEIDIVEIGGGVSIRGGDTGGATGDTLAAALDIDMDFGIGLQP